MQISGGVGVGVYAGAGMAAASGGSLALSRIQRARAVVGRTSRGTRGEREGWQRTLGAQNDELRFQRHRGRRPRRVGFAGLLLEEGAA